MEKKVLMSFDIDGTLEVGDPPGPITLDMVRKAQAAGIICGSSSDRSMTAQQNLWDRAGITPAFTSLKHMLADIKEQFEADYYYHTGDRDLDKQFALEAGFSYMWYWEAEHEPWLNLANGEEPDPEWGTAPAPAY
ncbi:MAG: hypothetical protein MK028_05200 [Dehalococcoidia bacterium]|nr:hypothetical protein [Dehalococcoidia bacterium]MQF99976.1 hypothetical protein [SAR202 cluster bacterium]